MEGYAPAKQPTELERPSLAWRACAGAIRIDLYTVPLCLLDTHGGFVRYWQRPRRPIDVGALCMCTAVLFRATGLVMLASQPAGRPTDLPARRILLD